MGGENGGTRRSQPEVGPSREGEAREERRGRRWKTKRKRRGREMERSELFIPESSGEGDAFPNGAGLNPKRQRTGTDSTT